MDLLTEIDSNTLHYIDWKTGSRVDWKTFENGKPITKTIEMIEKDAQLQLYHYVIRKKFPQYNDVYMTLYFTKAGGPFTIKFTKNDLPKHENFIKDLFYKIKNVNVPSLIKEDKNKNPHCNFCQFNKNKINGKESYCSFFEKKIQDEGLDKVTEDDILLDTHFKYEGGGATRIIE
jgi:hypothetical protein